MRKGRLISINKVFSVKNISIGEIKLKLGKKYYLGNKLVIFIQPTNKGFNFLSVKTHKCLLTSLIYRRKNKEDIYRIFTGYVIYEAKK